MRAHIRGGSGAVQGIFYWGMLLRGVDFPSWGGIKLVFSIRYRTRYDTDTNALAAAHSKTDTSVENQMQVDMLNEYTQHLTGHKVATHAHTNRQFGRHEQIDTQTDRN